MAEYKMFNEETESKIAKLNPMLKIAVEMLVKCIKKLVEGECDESTVSQTMSTINANMENKYSENELLNYDQAGTILGFGTTNRKGLKKLLDKHNVKQVTFGNVKVGFNRKDIIDLKKRIEAR